MEFVRCDRADRVAVVTLTDPARRNAVSLGLAEQLTGLLTSIGGDPEVRAVVITGDGAAFCSGADRALLREADEALLRQVYGAFLAVRDLPVPTVAAVNGPAVGAGFNLALACDVRIAARSAVFDPRFVSIPIHPGGGHTWLLERAAGAQTAAAMTLFGHPVDGPRAAELGLAWSCVPDAGLLDASLAFCAHASAAPARLVREVKETLRIAPGFPDHAAASEFELRRQLDSTTRAEYRERIGARR